MKGLFKKLANRQVISYLVFGVLTTGVNYAVFSLLLALWGEEAALIINAIAFAVSVAFAYVVNKLFVFESKSWSVRTLAREISAFVGARLFSFGLEEVGLSLAKDVLKVGRFSFFGIGGLMIAKLALSVIVVVLNYFFSKFLIFAKKN